MLPIAVLLIAVLLIAVVAGCGTADQNDTQTTPAPSGLSDTDSITPSPSIPPFPTPFGAGELPKTPIESSTVRPDPSCQDPTASLRPTTTAPDGSPLPQPNVDAIRERGRLIVGLDTGSNPFSFRDPRSSDLVGFDVDIASEIARELFGDPNQLEFRIVSSAEREEALMNGLVDVVVKTMSITCERRASVDFSTVYYQAHQRVLVRSDSGVRGGAEIRGINDLHDRTVCVAGGTTSLNRIQQTVPTARIVRVTEWADCLVMMQQNQIDAVSTDDTLLAGMAAQDPYLAIVGESLSEEPYGVGIPAGHDDMVRLVNAALERIRGDGTWNRIYDRWLTVLGPSPGPPTPRYVDDR